MTKMRIGLIASAIASVAVLGGFAARGQAAGPAERQPTSTRAASGLLAFGGNLNGTRGGIFVQRADGSSPAVEVAGGPAFGPAWAPDSRKLAYSHNDGVWVVNADGHGRRQLTFNARHAGLPIWSPDGRSIAWAVSVGSDAQAAVQVVSAHGSHLRTIAHICVGRAGTSSYRPSWSPNGKWLVLGSGCYPRLSIVRASDGRVRMRIRGAAADPAWSPNGKTIAFTRSGALWAVRPNGTHLRQLTDEGQDVWGAPAWSPNSRRIAYLDQASSAATVDVVNADGTDGHTVLDHVYGPVAWSPNSTRLALIQGGGGQLYTIRADGESSHLIATGVFEYEYSPPVWAR